ncbi:MAG: class II aldolase/adducin family protein [Spirochaetota bacterium]|nr:MAG: class II aldolase/adducin family protein [Spirochaetota bacterium]
MLEELRQIVWEANIALPKNRLVTATSGNASARDKDTELVVIKPSGYDFDKLKPEHLNVVNLKGEVVEGKLSPSVDTATHLYVYRHVQGIHGIIHTHSPYATSFAALGQTIPLCLTTLAMEFGTHIPVSDFATIGGEEIGKEIVKRIGTCPAILMRNHGVFTVGPTVQAALKAAVMLEEAAQTVHYAMLRGTVDELPDNVIEEAFKFYKEKYGQKSGSE